MRRRRWIVILSSMLLGLLLAMFWRSHFTQQRQIQRDLLLAYARGPLSERLYVSSRGWPVWQGARLSQAERHALRKDCLERASLGVKDFREIIDQAPASGLKDRLKALLPGQIRSLELAQALFDALEGSAHAKELLAREIQERKALAEALESIRAYGEEHVGLKFEDLMELNALLYSLKEPLD